MVPRNRQVRIQTGEKGGPFRVASNIIRGEGIGAMYKGLSAGLLRQALYTTARLGLYTYGLTYSQGATEVLLP